MTWFPAAAPRTGLWLAVSLSCSACLLPAQSWQIPERGVAHYKRQRQMEPAQPPGGLSLPRTPMPPLLFAGELDKKRQYLEYGTADLRDLGALLAFDLRRIKSRGRYEWRMDAIPHLPPLVLKIQADKPDAEGWQQLRVAFDAPPAPGARTGQTSAQGKLEIRRRFDAQRGVIAAFSSKMTVEVQRGNQPAGPARLQVDDEWTFDRVTSNRPVGFTSRVAATIREGRERLLRQLKRMRLPEPPPEQNGGGHFVDRQAGSLALVLLTLVKAGVDKRDTQLVAGFDLLRQHALRDTYTLSVALMAMEALYAPGGEREALIEGRQKAPARRVLSAADRKLAEEWTSALLGNFDITRKPKNTLRFHYVKGSSSYDNSNTQYALLGLYSAYLCGVEIPDHVWMAQARHWLQDLQRSDDKRQRVRLHTTSIAEYRRLVSAEDSARRDPGLKDKIPRRTISKRAVKPGGWPYINTHQRGTQAGGGARRPARQGMPNSGSMTTAGITGVTICEAVLRTRRQGRGMLRELQEAREAGLGWLLENCSLRSNVRSTLDFYYYYLYGFERACELSQVGLLGERDWYFEGATILLESKRGGQGPAMFQGGGVVQTCFAILFLKMAAPPLPVLSGR